MSLKAERLKSELTQAELAHKVNVATNTIARLERGETGASVRLLKLLSEVLNCTVNDLLEESSAV